MNSALVACVVSISIMLAGCQQVEPFSDNAVAATPSTENASASNPIVVELYQSQGCSSCPPANAALNAVADHPDVIALSFAVTYWDRLGWKDIFGDKAFTQRQYDYASSFGNANVYTPQVVINGKKELTGIRRGELASAVSAAKPLSGGPAISAEQGMVRIGKGSGNAKIWLVRYDPRIQNVAVRSGENSGRTLPHKNVVRSLDRLGEWDGTIMTYQLPRSANAVWKSVILVQSNKSGAIIAAKRL